MMRSFIILLWVGLIAIPAAGFAQDVTRTFDAPKVNGVRLDWCKHWARQCGQPAADLFCQQRGFSRAVRFPIAPNIGRTVVFGDGRLCIAPNCSGFRAITCTRPGPKKQEPIQSVQPKPGKSDTGRTVGTPKPVAGPDMTVTVVDANTTRYRYPKVKNVRLDWCRHWRKSCGQPAANLFCQENGFQRAIRFSVDRNAGRRGIQTLVFGDGRICKGARCRGFRQITCVRAPQPTVQQAEDQPALDRQPVAPDVSDSVAIPVPTPRPTVRVDDPDRLTIKLDPAVSFAEFKPLTPVMVTRNWVTVLQTLDTYPSGASLYKCASGDCSLATTADEELNPQAEFQSVQRNFNVTSVPHAKGARWQIGYLPFPAFKNGSDADLDPPGLLKSGLVEIQQGWFAFDMKELAAGLPSGLDQAIIHIRVLPVATAGSERVVGQPSNVMRLFYGAKLPPQDPYEIYSKEEVPGSKPDLQLIDLKFEPYRSVERWPPGCKTWEEKYGKKDKNLLEMVGDFFSGAWSWTSKAYQWVKDRAIDIAGALTLNLIPDSVLSFALDTALVSVGIPPDIPNLDQLMRDGVDGLAREVAKTAVQQIPSADLAANVGNLAADIAIDTAAGMAEDELRERLEKEIENRSRQALLTAADEMEKQLRETGKKALCKSTTFHSVFHVTVRNAGGKPLRDVSVIANAGPVYRGANWKVDLAPGEQLRLVTVGTPMLTNGPYSHPLLRPHEREEEDMRRWWNEILRKEKATIKVTFPGARYCLGGDPESQFCEQESVTAHASPPQLVSEPYAFAP